MCVGAGVGAGSICHGMSVDVRGQLGELALSFHQVGPETQTLTARLSRNHLYLLSHFTSEIFTFLIR